MEKVKKLLQFVRLVDENGDLSLTNIIVIVILLKIVLKSDAIQAIDVGGILAALLGYQGKRAIKAKETIEKERIEMPKYMLSTSDLYHMGNMSEASEDVIKEGKITIARVNKLLKMISLDLSPIVTSGYRSPAHNAKIGGSKKSSHMSGMAIDLADKNGKIKAQITEKMLEEAGLYMEHPSYTKTWIHLQTRPTSRRIFYPY